MTEDNKSIDNLITDLLERIDLNYSKTHPNISNLWREYIIKKYNSLSNDIIECNKLLDNLLDKDDISISHIMIAFIINNSINNSFKVK